MRTLLAVFVLFATGIAGGAQAKRVVHAASLSEVSIAPGSIITIFGENLAAGEAFAANAQFPPQTLGGVSVTIGGAAASLFYVAPPRLFSLYGNGTRDGARSNTVEVTSLRAYVSNEDEGSVSVIDLAAPAVTQVLPGAGLALLTVPAAPLNGTTLGAIAVQSDMDGDDGQDGHSDRSGSASAPVIQMLSPNSGKAGTTIALTVVGANFTGATGLEFGGEERDFKVSNVKVVNGTVMTATVAIAGSASAGPRVVRVVAGKESSTGGMTSTNTFTVTK